MPSFSYLCIMLEVVYDDIDYRVLFPKYAKALGSVFENNRVVLPPTVGKGYLELVPLADHLFASVENFTPDIHIKFCRKRSDEPFFILHFDDLKGMDHSTIKIDGEEVNAKGKSISTVMLTSNMFDFCYVLPPKTQVSSIYILIQKKWLKDFLELDNEDEVLRTYLSLRANRLNREPFNPEYRRYFSQVFETPDDRPLRQLHLRNAIMMLVEIFFSRLYKNLAQIKGSPIIRMDNTDLYKMMEVESMLIKDFSKAPPTIADLAAYTEMSVSKLKSSFKRVYGTGIYEYYQKNRMHKARQLLTSHAYSVKEVGVQLGYSNLSNFSLAFKKEFGVLPSSL